MRELLKWSAAGALAGLALGVADGVAILVGASEMFFDTREMLRTTGWAIGLCAGAGTLLALGCGVVVELLASLARPGGALARRWQLEIALAVALSGPLDYVLWQLTGGPQASQLPAREALVAASSGLAALGIALAATRLARWSRAAASRRLALFVGCSLAAAALYAVDRGVLVRLYPVFHAALSVAALLVAAAGLRQLVVARPGPRLTALLLLLPLGAVVGGGFALAGARASQNPRFVIGERTAAAAEVIELARLLKPPPRELLLDEAPLEPAAEERAASTLSRPGASVIMITVDAMRWDRLRPPAGQRRVTPNIDAFADGAVVFDRAYTPMPHTSYAISSLLTGKYTGPLVLVPGAPAVHETWPEIMRRFRYRTGGFFTKAVFFVDRPRFEPYLRKGLGFEQRDMEYETPATERVRQTIEFLDANRHGDAPVFSWTHFFEAHEPYEPTCPRFGDAAEDRYDCELANVDAALAPLFERIAADWDDAIVIVAADHGEEFGEHGGRFHGTTLYDEQVRVPLVLRVPGVTPRRVAQPVGLVDLLGTVLALVDIPVPARVRSIDLRPLIVGTDSRRTEAYSQVHGETMIVRDGHKLIWDREADVARLYDLAADPGEQRSVAARKAELSAQLKRRILAWEQSHARVELRPVATADGLRGWPPAVQRAIGGDEEAVALLPAIAAGDAPLPVRRKAAELLADLWDRRPPAGLADLAADDPEVALWLAVARQRAGDPAALVLLAERQADAPELSEVWRAAALERLDAGDAATVPDVERIAAARGVPMPERVRAVQVLGAAARRSSTPVLLPLIDEYQLALELADTLAAIGDRSALEPLLARLRRERFPERRARIASALARLGDRRAAPTIARELARAEPNPSALGALVALRAVPPRGRSFPGEPGESDVTAWARPQLGELPPSHAAILRVIVRTRADADGGGLLLTCNGAPAGRFPIFAGEQEGHVELSGCTGSTEAPPRIELGLDPVDLAVEVLAVAAVGSGLASPRNPD